MVKDLSVVTAMAQVRPLAQQLLCAMGTAKKKKKKKKKDCIHFLWLS